MDSRYTLKSADIIIEPSEERDLWNSDWIVTLRSENREIGRVSFAGDKAYGLVPIRLELEEEYRNRGYGTEVLKMMTGWAFSQKGIYEIAAVTTHDNDKCVKALGKAGYVFRNNDGPVEHYSIRKQKTAWTGLYLIIGLFLGVTIGIVTGEMWVGFGIGMLICLAFGAILDGSAARERANVIGRRK